MGRQDLPFQCQGGKVLGCCQWHCPISVQFPLSIHGDGTPMVGIGKAWGRVHTKYEHSWLQLSKLIVYTKPFVPVKNVKPHCLQVLLSSGSDCHDQNSKQLAPGLSNPNHWGSITMDGKRELDRNWTVPLTASQNFSTLALEGQILSTQAAL